MGLIRTTYGPFKTIFWPSGWLFYQILLLYLDLKKYTEYTVQVSASTTVGEGLRSSPLHILTDEDGKSEQKLQCIITCL